jgi:hypothetical protein
MVSRLPLNPKNEMTKRTSRVCYPPRVHLPDHDMGEPALPASSKKFLSALKAATPDSPVSLQLSEFYDEENELRKTFAAKTSVSDHHANLVPVFHSKVAAMGANKIKARKVDETNLEEKYICPLEEKMRMKTGEDCFIQDGHAGFKRNWDVFTEGALAGLNWQAS